MSRLLRVLAWWILDRYPSAVEDRAHAWWTIDAYPDILEDRLHAHRLLRDRRPLGDEIDEALLAGMRECGVCVDNVGIDDDLGGKRYEVLHYAANTLGNPIRTLADIKALLK